MKKTRRSKTKALKRAILLAVAIACVCAAYYFNPLAKNPGDALAPIISETPPEPTPEQFANNAGPPAGASEMPSLEPTKPPAASEPETTLEPTQPLPAINTLSSSGRPLINYIQEQGALELPVNGASGYASVKTSLYASPKGSAIGALEPGQGFTIQEETGDWWRVLSNGNEGWVKWQSCMINLPDVIPSIVYNITNASSSVASASGMDLPGITGESLYPAFGHNARLGRDEYTAPALYTTALKICSAQQAALADGNTLIIYEAFRPRSAQLKIANSLAALVEAEPAVKQGVSTPPWTIRWFVANGRSSHQQGCAMDVSLGKAGPLYPMASGGYSYHAPREYEEYAMPTSIHEHSVAAVVFKTPVQPRDKNAWLNAEPAETMNAEALLLQKYCTGAGFVPLSSEWWHFDDVDSLGSESRGDFAISDNFSEEPDAEN